MQQKVLVMACLAIEIAAGGCSRVSSVPFSPDGMQSYADGMNADSVAADAWLLDGSLRLDGGAADIAQDVMSPDLVVHEAGPTSDLGASGGDSAASAPWVPRNVGDRLSFSGTTALTVPSGQTWLVETDTGAITSYLTGSPSPLAVVHPPDRANDGFFVPLPSSDPERSSLAVFQLSRLSVAKDARLVAVGERPLVFLVAGEAQIEGVLSVAADAWPARLGPGAGGFAGRNDALATTSGPGAGKVGIQGDPSWLFGGGGGGSHGGAGGRGGRGTVAGVNAPGAPGQPGSTYASADLVPLKGGSGGGAGGSYVPQHRGQGGPGGGAIQLSARERLVIGVGGSIDASGGGGRCGPSGVTAGGGGGGAGGAILLEAPIVVIDGFVGANGGSGAMGSSSEVACTPGSRGLVDRAPAPGSASFQELAGGGGAGSDAMGLGSDGLDAQRGGGGGGGAGLIQINTRSGSERWTHGLLPGLDAGLARVGKLFVP